MKYQIQSLNSDRELSISQIVKTAAEATHCAFKAQAEVNEITQIILAGDWECMFACLQKYINKYRGFIVGLSPLTNVMVVNLTKEIMPALTEEVVRWQLQVMIGFVYAYHALLGSSRIAFQEYFTKLSKRLI
jgi:hypothetical protein